MTTTIPGRPDPEQQVRDGAPAPDAPPAPAPYVDHQRDDAQHRTAEERREPPAAGASLAELKRREEIDDEAAAVTRPPSDS